MYCKKCGKSIDNDSVYCSYCGSKQSTKIKLGSSLSDYKRVIKFENVDAEPSTPPIPKEKYEPDKFSDTKCTSTIISELTPPPVPNNKLNPSTENDSSIEKRWEATIVGIFLAIAFIVIPNSITIPLEYFYLKFVVLIAVRIIVTIWIGTIAKYLNRDTIGWGVLGFVSPSISLIIIGFLPKKVLEEPNQEDTVIQ